MFLAEAARNAEILERDAADGFHAQRDAVAQCSRHVLEGYVADRGIARAKKAYRIMRLDRDVPEDGVPERPKHHAGIGLIQNRVMADGDVAVFEQDVLHPEAAAFARVHPPRGVVAEYAVRAAHDKPAEHAPADRAVRRTSQTHALAGAVEPEKKPKYP